MPLVPRQRPTGWSTHPFKYHIQLRACLSHREELSVEFFKTLELPGVPSNGLVFKVEIPVLRLRNYWKAP